MVRVTRPGGFILIWDHNALNPYWKIIMKRVPQDRGDERIISREEMLQGLKTAGIPESNINVVFLGFVPDFIPRWLLPAFRALESLVEIIPGLRQMAAHNVFIARKGQ